MAFLKNLDHLFEEKSLGTKILEKVKNPRTYIPLVPYFNLWHYNKYSKNKNSLISLFYGLYAIPPTLKLAWIGLGVYTGTWEPLEQYKKIENFVKPEKEKTGNFFINSSFQKESQIKEIQKETNLTNLSGSQIKENSGKIFIHSLNRKFIK